MYLSCNIKLLNLAFKHVKIIKKYFLIIINYVFYKKIHLN